jgi:hypothetical protein
MFNVVHLFYVADVESVSDFVPDPMNHVSIFGRNRFVIRAHNSFRLAEKNGTVLCL